MRQSYRVDNDGVQNAFSFRSTANLDSQEIKPVARRLTFHRCDLWKRSTVFTRAHIFGDRTYPRCARVVNHLSER